LYFLLEEVTQLVTKEQLFIQLIEQLSSRKLFYGHAVVDAEDEAMMVLMKLLSQDVEQILSSGTDSVLPEVIAEATSIVNERLTSLKPMAYLLGQVNFSGLMFRIDERALVPRSPIAELIINGFQPWVKMAKIHSVLDLCTGSGCIGIAIAQHFKHTQVDIADISKKALALASINIELHHAQNRVTAIRSDLFHNIKNSYDLIVTNPPYVSDEEYHDLPAEYKHEPKLGLVTEQQGLRIPVEILYKATEYLNDGGYLFLEVGYSDEALDSAFSEIKFEWIDFLNGGQGVCVFSKEMLLKYRHYFKAFLETSHVI